MKAEAFTFEHERVNLREHVAWCHTPKDEDTFMLAQDYLAMGIAKAQKVTVPQPLPGGISKKLLVVGDGVAGKAAAEGALEAGYEVAVLDKAHRIVKTEGQPGLFDVTVENGAGPETMRVGAIVLATGWKPYDASKLGHLGYGASPDVITNAQFEEMKAAGRFERPSDGKAPRERAVRAVRRLARREPPALLLHCLLPDHAAARGLHPGSRAPRRRSTSSTRTSARRGRPRCSTATAQDDALTFLTKGEVESVTPQAGGTLRVAVKTRWWVKASRWTWRWWCSPRAWFRTPPMC